MKNGLRIGAVVAAVFLLLTSCGRGGRGKSEWHELGMMSDPILDEVLLFYLGEAWAGLTDVGECLETASRVNVKDPESWSAEWRKTAERLDRTAMETLEAGHELSAGELSLRASSYYRAALHRHMDPTASEVRELTEKEVAAFTRAIRLLGWNASRVEVPFEGSTMGGYWFTSSVAEGPAPAVIVHQGRDAWAEDCLYLAQEANRRGYHALIIDGPGQGSTLRLKDLKLRHDWETVVAADMEYLSGLPEVDMDLVGLIGLSMGGALGPRAAAYEKRVAFLVANPGVLSWSSNFFNALERISPMVTRMYERNPARLNRLMNLMARMDPFIAWGMTDSMWKHGSTSPSGHFDDMKMFDATADVGRITCPTLIIDGEAELYGQARELYDALNCEKTYLLFTDEEAASLHVQTAAIAVGSQRVFDWIDDTIDALRRSGR